MYPRVRTLVHLKLTHDFRRKHRWMFAAFSTSDVVQEVFLRVAANLPQFQGRDEDSLIAYLATVVHNRLLDMLRHHGAARRDVNLRVTNASDSGETPIKLQASQDATPSERIVAREHLAIYLEVLKRFPEKQQSLLRYRLEDGLAFSEIARRLGYASAEVSCKAFHGAKARLLVRLQTRGVQFTITGRE